jgi:hypothetical protein
MAAMTDTYSAGEAARLLGISERRARQLAAAGHLTVEQAKPLRISARSVIEERKRRERKPKAESSGPAGLEPAQLREIVSAIVGDLLPLALEGQRRIEDGLREELAAARAEVAQLRAEQLLDSGAGKKAKKGKKGKKRRLWRD